jgi:hypothetical protein
MSRKYISGFLRLGIVLSAGWIILFPTIYSLALIGFYSNPRISYALRALYMWTEGETGRTNEGFDFTPTIPHFSLPRFISFYVVPLFFGWLLLYVLPRSIRWVAEGFRLDQ